MTQEQAMNEFAAMFPTTVASQLRVERQRTIDGTGRVSNEYYLFNHDNHDSCIVASSERSWEHALAIAKSGNEDIWPQVDESMNEGEVI